MSPVAVSKSLAPRPPSSGPFRVPSRRMMSLLMETDQYRPLARPGAAVLAPLAAECLSGRYGSPFKEGALEDAHDRPDGIVLIDRTLHAVEGHTAGHGIKLFDLQFTKFVVQLGHVHSPACSSRGGPFHPPRVS